MLAAVWIAMVVVVSIQATAQHNNNFEIFRSAWTELLAGRDLYAPSERHRDFFKYSPPFALLFAPFAIVPFWLGVLLWNGANAGALWWGLGRVLTVEQAFAARVLVFMDTVGALQNVQSNALVAGLMLLAFAELERRREASAALAVAIGTAVKLFPVLAATFAVFRPYRAPRFALLGLAAGGGLLLAPLLVTTPAQLLDQYRSWLAITETDTLDRGHSVMQQLQLWFGGDLPNWPVQLAGLAALLAPLIRLPMWGLSRFRLLYVASVLMFCVLFNHKAESPTFVVALAGIAIWFAVAPRAPATWALLALVIVGTVLPSSDAMPRLVQERFFEAYRVKIIPVLLVWLLVQWELWRMRVQPAGPQSASARSAGAPAGPAATAP